MSVFSKVKDFFGRHKNKFIVGGIIITGSVILTQYAQQRLKEWQEKETAEFLDRTRKQQHFESIDRTCNQTVLSLSVTLYDYINQLINTEQIIEDIKNNPENKLLLWNQLKVMVFTKVACLNFSIAILIVTLRIQLSIIGGCLFKDPNSVPAELQEKYLSLCENFLKCGVKKITTFMESEFAKILDKIDLKKPLKLSDIESFFWGLQASINGNRDNPIDKIRELLILEDVSNLQNNNLNIYNTMIRDTADLLESEEVKSLLTYCTNKGFLLISDMISEFYVGNGVGADKIVEVSTSKEFINPFVTEKPVAKLLPIINGLLSKKSFPDKFVEFLIADRKVQLLGANVYECLL